MGCKVLEILGNRVTCELQEENKASKETKERLEEKVEHLEKLSTDVVQVWSQGRLVAKGNLTQGKHRSHDDLWWVSLEQVGNSPWQTIGTLEIRMGAVPLGSCLPTTDCFNDTRALCLNRYDPGENVGEFSLLFNTEYIYCLDVRVGPFESREDYLALGGQFPVLAAGAVGSGSAKNAGAAQPGCVLVPRLQDVLRILEVPEKTTGEYVALCRDEAQRLQERIASGELVYFVEIACRNQVNLILALIAQEERQMNQVTE